MAAATVAHHRMAAIAELTHRRCGSKEAIERELSPDLHTVPTFPAVLSTTYPVVEASSVIMPEFIQA